MGSPCQVQAERMKSLSSFVFREVIGKGWLGQVYLAVDKEDQIEYAVKKLSKAKIKREDVEEHILEEIKINASLKHPNIVQMVDCLEDSRCFYLVLEKCDSDLGSYLDQNKRLDEDEAMSYFVQLLEAIDYLHQLNIYHRDIKPENVLKGTDGTVKLCDFGFAAKSARRRETLCGTAEYMAPEMVRHDSYRHKIDIWSLGCLLYELVTGDVPFGERGEGDECETTNDCEYHSLYHRILEQPIRIPRYVSWQMADLIKWMLEKTPSLRPSTSELKKHALVVSAQDKLHEADVVDESMEVEDKENVRVVTPPCSVVVEKLRASTKGFLRHCSVEVEKLCLSELTNTESRVSEKVLRCRDSKGRVAPPNRPRYNLRRLKSTS